MTSGQRNLLLGGGALLVAAGAGFGAARLLAPAPLPATAAASDAAPKGLSLKVPAAYLASAGVQLETVATGDMAAEIRAAATVESTPDAEAVATAGAAGAVTRIAKRLGDPVRAGEVLATISSRDAAAAAADRSVAEARVAQARHTAERERMLNAEGVSPRQDLEAAQTALAAAEAEAHRARTAAASAGVSADGRSARVVSPISGRITAEGAGLGAFVQMDTVIFRIADPRRVQVEAQVSGPEAARIKAGDAAVIVTPAGARVPAAVRAVTPSLDPQTRAATVVLAPAQGSVLTPGEAVQAVISPKAGGGRAIVVADEAVQRIDGRDTVFVRTADGFAVRPVTVGARGGGRAGILAGLNPGEVIAARNAFLLKAELGKGEDDE
jgi:cobalt-zinc-cadmium efflux system membrane fusion protein